MRGMTMRTSLAVTALCVSVIAGVALAGRGGAARGGVRGAVVGNAVGGESGAKAGAVIGATRGAINREATVRAQYQTTTEYQQAPRSNFSEAPPDVVPVEPGSPAKSGAEAVIRKNGQPLVGITFPADWKQKTGEGYISAVSKDGQAYAMLVTLEGIKDQKAGAKKVQAGLENHLQDVKYDEPSKTKGGALVISGTGKGKKKNVDVVFAAAIFDAGKGQFVGAAFVVDSSIEDHYKETVSGICQTLRRAEDFGK
jgi:hypothetical protein